MSDPVSNHDIEDVLSSIRRLVAQGDPRRNVPAANAPTPLHPDNAKQPMKEEASAKPALTERLVLTPALRVNEPEVTPSPAVPGAVDNDAKSIDAAIRTPESDVIPTKDSRPIPPPAPSPSERASLEATIAELEAAVNSRADEWEPDGSEVNSTPNFHMAFLNGLGARTPAPRHEDDGAEIDDTELTLNDVVMDHIAETVSQEIADAFPQMNAADEEHVIDDTVIPLQRAGYARSAPEAEMRPEPVENKSVEITEPEVAEPLTFRHARVEVVYDPVAEATADAAEAEAGDEDIYGDELAVEEPAPSTAMTEQGASTALVDPDMLREMVALMIREELQGEMGERITRNVRKLVRREINRVLSAQEFD